MQCEIADLIVEVPEAGDLVPRCKDYLIEGTATPDIVIKEERFRKEKLESLGHDLGIYMESGCAFLTDILNFEGTYLHSSAIAYQGKAYLFSGRSGVGKSTHTNMWKKLFGEEVQIFNDDKPALRLIDGTWYAYGTPWCGKDGININMKVPVAGICFMKQGKQNKIRRLSNTEAVQQILPQTLQNIRSPERMLRQLDMIGKLVERIPVYELENLPNEEAARLSYETMRQGL